MKVYQVVLEGPKIEPPLKGVGDRQTNSSPRSNGVPSNITSVEIQQSSIKGADGKPLFKVVDQNGKVLFTGSEADANTNLDKLRKNIPVNAPTIDNKPIATNPNDKPPFTAGSRLGTPTSDQLTNSEKRKLARTGRISRKVNGKNEIFTSSNIADADKIAKIKVPPFDTDGKPAAGGPPGDDALFKGKYAQALNTVWSSRIGRLFRGFLGASSQATLQTAFNAMVLEDVLDAYLRAIRDYGISLNNKSAAEKAQFRKTILDGNINSVPVPIQDAYLNAIEQTTKLFVEVVLGVILTLGWAGVMAFTAFGLATGGAGIIASLAAGGAFIWGGTALLSKLLEETGINDAIENWIASELLSLTTIMRVALSVDGAQEFFAAGADIATSWISSNEKGSTVGNLIRDDINEADASNVKVDSAAATAALKELVQSSPKLMKAYKAGKEEAKAQMRSTTTAS